MPTKRERGGGGRKGDGMRRAPGIERRFSESGLGVVKSFQAPLPQTIPRLKIYVSRGPLVYYIAKRNCAEWGKLP